VTALMAAICLKKISMAATVPGKKTMQTTRDVQ
jgi:hypothetical protein